MSRTTPGVQLKRFGLPAEPFTLLCAADGRYLSSADGKTLALSDQVDDASMWRAAARFTSVRHAVTGLSLSSAGPAAPGRVARLRLDAAGPAAGGNTFTAERGPDRLPSVLLRDLRRDGWVCLPALLDTDTVAELDAWVHAHAGGARHAAGRLLAFNRTAAVARAAAEPVSLWLTRQYLQTEEVRLAHAPSIAVLDRDDGRRDVQGWHSDFPYLWGSPAAVGGDRVAPGAAGAVALGVQRNACITAFSAENGATCFRLGSHAFNAGPPRDWGVDADYARPGHRRRHGLPYAGPEVTVIEAPPGSVILYDARTWHRPGENRTDRLRAALLQAVTPMYIIPFKDTSASYKAFLNSPLAAQLSERERREITRLMVHHIVGPDGRQAITVDEDVGS